MWNSGFFFPNLERPLFSALIDVTKPSTADRRSAKDWDRDRLCLFLMALQHKGEQSLRLLLPGGIEAALSIVEEVMDRISELEDEELAPSPQPDYFAGMRWDIQCSYLASHFAIRIIDSQ